MWLCAFANGNYDYSEVCNGHQYVLFRRQNYEHETIAVRS